MTLICCHGGDLTPECDPCLSRARLECAAVGHLTARGAHERAWGEPLPAGSQNPDLCLRCGETEAPTDVPGERWTLWMDTDGTLRANEITPTWGGGGVVVVREHKEVEQ